MNFTGYLNILGGLGIFLLGVKLMSDGLEVIAGSKLKILIEKLTKNKYMAALVGVIVTAVIHSSAVTTVMVVGFINAGIMNLKQAVGVIMGSNIGTTITGLMASLDLSLVAPGIICLGVTMLFFMSKNFYKSLGQIITGFGMLFFGLDFMGKSMEPLRNSQTFVNLMASFRNPFLGLFAGLIITAILHSSTAVIGVLQSLAKAGVVDLKSVVFIIYGQNVGTCVTALMASTGANKTAKRSAVIHLLFNVIGTLIFLLITLVMPFTSWIECIARESVKAQISLIHLIFNIVTTLLLLPFDNILIKMSSKFIKGKDEAINKNNQDLIYLDNRILNAPAIAVSQVLKEVNRMARLSQNNFEVAISSFFEKNKNKIKEVYEREKTIDYLSRMITEYLVKVNGLDISDTDKKIVGSLFHVVSDIERIGDHCENICESSEIIISGKAKLSFEALNEIKNIKNLVLQIIKEAVIIFSHRKASTNDFKNISYIEDSIDEKTESFRGHYIERLNNKKCTAISGAVFLDVLTNLERIADHATNIAFSIKKYKAY
ncbi:MAG: Na/Pi cotransporter family protein [Oscillospiraceae bacterium]|jgi:phosphate:Na+ symporter|nr:Na/Pi cotransporter family protein [Oscillospiraceae bacterium]